MMDPLSIATGCASLITTIGSLTLSITSFVRSCREARSDLDRVSRELHSLQTVLELIQEDAKDDTKSFPETIQRHVSGIVTNCNLVVIEVQTCITKYGDGKVRNKAAWVLNGQGDMEKLRSSLEAHKSALELALDMLTLSVTKDIKTDTTEILNDTAAIKDDTSLILEEIARLQARLPATAAAPNDYILQKFLEDMATYTESTLDVDGGFSDRASSKALSFIDEDEEIPHVLSRNLRRMIPPSAKKNDESDTLKEPPFARMVKRKSLIGGTYVETAQASAKEIWSRPNWTQQQPSFASETLQLEVKPTSDVTKTQIIPLRPGTPKSMDYVDASERYERSTSLPGSGQKPKEVVTNSRPSSDTSSAGSDRLVDKPDEQQPSPELQDLSPELVYRIAYNISTFFNNFVLHLPVPESILKGLSRTDDTEFTHSRFTFVTCQPRNMVGERYCLRPTFWTTKPKTKFVLLLVVHPADQDRVTKWTLIHDAIAYAERKLGPDTWKQVRVNIHFARYNCRRWSAFLERIGLIQGFRISAKAVNNQQVLSEALTQDTKEVAEKKVEGTMHEYTVQLRGISDGLFYSEIEIAQADIPIQVVVTRYAAGYVTGDYGDFGDWSRSILSMLDGKHIIHMDSFDSMKKEDYKFLYRAWTTTKPLGTINNQFELIKSSDLIKQTRTLKERILS
ncbi:hypothetical protein EDB82DRAFT_556770 [Fusarium venenatum]|uniref:uncharacterized protein n=1 Tax=Fusarium venenatum TaxID=56646 RepID=UPI001D4E52C6|nr:hypothetical protein EDB82DRAFT_556770 [Fusarium venenatum]